MWLGRLVGKYGFEKLFAIKTIRGELASGADFRAMFLDEARVVSHIHDDHVVEIVELGEANGHLFMVMDWVDGEPLTCYADRAKISPLPVDVAVTIVLDACRGLHAAHEARGTDGELLHVVHRDVSPQNILVTAQGRSRVIDFGIAKARDRFANESSIGSLKGKVRYMAPEQVRGLTVGPSTDVFALACVLYELLTGAPPFDAEGDAIVVHRLLLEKPATRVAEARAPAPIAEVVARALSLDRDGRYASMDSFRVALEAAARAAGFEPSHEAVRAFAAEHLREVTDRRQRFVQEALGATKPVKVAIDSAMPFDATKRDASTPHADTEVAAPPAMTIVEDGSATHVGWGAPRRSTSKKSRVPLAALGATVLTGFGLAFVLRNAPLPRPPTPLSTAPPLSQTLAPADAAPAESPSAAAASVATAILPVKMIPKASATPRPDARAVPLNSKALPPQKDAPTASASAALNDGFAKDRHE